MGIGKFFNSLKQQTADAVARRGTAFVRGKVAGKPVTDDAGAMIVDAGHVIDDAVIARADAAGKMSALVAAAAAAQAQDLRAKVGERYDATPEGQERRALETVDTYIEARRYIGRYTGVDVMDLTGSVVVPAGKKIVDEDVRAARDADLLGALIYAAEQEPPPGAAQVASVEPAAPVRRAPLLVPQDEEEPV